ncbi:acyl-CoA dehydrogenase family protein [Streptomyces sp. NPDC048521]|uniref:acyl-CoA dehydrogenase family protein n=1 Tax=Streptomyces sp. NPDC048521 TaxID=3365566 RepID=UPI003714D06D
MTTGIHDPAGPALGSSSAPVGVWTGTATHDGQTDPFTISFLPDGTVTLVTPFSSGRGTWRPTDRGFRYSFTETLDPAVTGMAGYVCVSVDAVREGSSYRGSGPATVHSADGAVVHLTSFETAAALQSPEGRDLVAERPEPAPADLAAWPPAPVRDAAVLAAAQAGTADSGRRVAPEVIEALTAAGFARWLVPSERGGEPRGYAELVRSVAALGTECASTAWLASLFAFAARYVACLPEKAQAEVWGDGPDARVCVVNKPLGTAVPVGDGWRLSGEWTFVSGVEYADWALLAGPAPAGPPGKGGEPPRFFLVPRADFGFRDTWHSLGMRGTGSHTLVLDDVLVPEYRTCLREDAMKGRVVGVSTPPPPTLAVNGLTFVAPALGAALGALRAAAHATTVPATGPREASGQAYQIGYARAAGLIDAAQLLLLRVAEVADTGRLNPVLVRRSRRDAAHALELLVEAVDLLLRAGGTRAQDDRHPLQRFWRDVHSVASHAVVQFEPAGLDYTRGLTS